MDREKLIALMKRLPVIEEISDKDYRSVTLPCFPFPELDTLAQFSGGDESAQHQDFRADARLA